jgi:hypothetical protein
MAVTLSFAAAASISELIFRAATEERKASYGTLPNTHDTPSATSSASPAATPALSTSLHEHCLGGLLARLQSGPRRL